MTLSADEKTIHDGQPIELYEFLVTGGDATAYRYTDHDVDLNVLSNTWVSRKAIHRSVIMAADAENAPEVEVSMPLDIDIVDDLIFQEPPRSVKLNIQRYHGNIANVGQVWKGKVRGAKIKQRTAIFRVPSLLTVALRTMIPTTSYQTLCNHILYDPNCTVVDSSFAEVRTVDVLGNLDREITVNTLTEDAQEYIGGYLKLTNGDTRLIVDAAGFTLRVMRPFRNLSVTDTINVFQGCDHKILTCQDKFDNEINFGGHPYLQVTDVFRRGVTGSGMHR